MEDNVLMKIVHSATEEVTFTALLHKLQKGTNRKSKKPPGFATRGMSIIARLEVTGGAGSVCVGTFHPIFPCHLT